MDESVTDEVRRQSILKSRPRFPLQEVQGFFGDEDTVTTTLTRNRRVSFGRKVIKEFLIGSAVSTQAVHEYEQSSESVSDPSDCSGPLDLALNKSCRDLEAEMEISGEVITPPMSFSDAKAAIDPEQRARQFTENCINIAKSVFQDTETELTAIIIGAKPTSSDEDKKNLSCMSFTTLEMSNDFGHKHDFMAMKHAEFTSDQNDKGRYDFLDHSLGNSTLGKLKQPRSPLASISHLAPWEQENDENIPPAHNGFRNARTSVFRPNTSEATMEFTCARMRSLDELEDVQTDDVKENPSFLDATNDEFIDDLLEEKETSSDDTDSSPFQNIQRQLANLSNVNQSFREKVQTLPGILNASSALNALELSNNSEPSFLQTAGNSDDECVKVSEEVVSASTQPRVDWPTPSKGNISVFDDTGDDSLLAAGQGEDMEFTHFNVKRSDETEPLTCSGEKTKIVEMTMNVEKTFHLQPVDSGPFAVENEQTMEFTHCNRLLPGMVEHSENDCEVSAGPASFVAEEPENPELANMVDNEQTMEFTHCNRLRPVTVEDISTEEKPTAEVKAREDSIAACSPTSTVEEENNLELTNEQTMEFTHCNRLRQVAVEEIAAEETSTTVEGTQKPGEDSTAACSPTSVVEEETDKLELPNEQTMEFTHCNLLRQETVEDNPTEEKSVQVKACEDTIEAPFVLEEQMKLESEESMEFTHCNTNEIDELIVNVENTTATENVNLVGTANNSAFIDQLENELTVEIAETPQSVDTECPMIETTHDEPKYVPSKETECSETTDQLINNDCNVEDSHTTTNSPETTESVQMTETQPENPSPIQENTPEPDTNHTNVNVSLPSEEYHNEEPAPMEMTNVENHETDDTLPADDSLLPDSQPFAAPVFERPENTTQANATMDPPLETPVTGLAALSARPSLQQQLQSAAPDSTICCEQSMDDALKSVEITQGSIGGVLPKPMKTMSEEQHMQAIHESTRVIEEPRISEDTFKIPTENTYTLHGLEEATYTVPGLLNVCSGSTKRTHTDSPCLGERLKKNRASRSPSVRDSFGKRLHTESPLPDQSLLKKTRESDTPRAARHLRLSVNESILVHGGVSANLDVSVTLNDITLSETGERSFGILPMSLPERSIVPEEMEMTEITVPAMACVMEQESITTNLPVLDSLLVDESELEVSSTTNNYPDMESDAPCGSQSLHDTTAGCNEKVIRKVHAALGEMSREPSCSWKLLKFDDGLIQVDLPLLATSLILDISFTDISVTSLRMTHRTTPSDQWREIKKQINEYGFETLRRYVQKEGKKIQNLADIPYCLDFFNNHAMKLRTLMNDAYTVLHGCAGSQLSGDVLSFRVLSYPGLISCCVDVNLNDLLVLDKLLVQFRHETGRLDERAVRALAAQVQAPVLQNFVRCTVAYTGNEETKAGFLTNNPPLLF